MIWLVAFGNDIHAYAEGDSNAVIVHAVAELHYDEVLFRRISVQTWTEVCRQLADEHTITDHR